METLDQDLMKKQFKYLIEASRNLEEPFYQAQRILERQFIGDPSLKRDYETIDLLYSSGYWYLPSLLTLEINQSKSEIFSF